VVQPTDLGVAFRRHTQALPAGIIARLSD
jgi:hypothetical protein